jgi:hypothetical protein
LHLRVVARFFVLVGHCERIIGRMHGLLPILNSGALHVEELALNAGIRTRVIVAVDAIFVFQQIVKRVAVDEIPALEIGIDEHRFALIALEIQVVAHDGL